MKFTFALLLLAIVGSRAESTKPNRNTTCGENEFYDHGIEGCEHCDIICENAEYKKTAEECRELCPAAYAILATKLEKPEVGFVRNGDNNPPGSDDPTHAASVKNTTIIAGAISAVLVLMALAIIGLALLVKKRNDRHKRVLNRDILRRVNAVQEENGEQAASERSCQAVQLLGSCDPREWFGLQAEETQSGRQGSQQLALLGSSQRSGIQETGAAATTFIVKPIYRPSGFMRSTRV